MPDGPGLELIAQEIGDAHDGAVLDTEYFRDQATLVVDPEQIVAVLTWLRDTEGQEYRLLTSVHGVDYMPEVPRFAVHYQMVNMPRVERLGVKAPLADPAAENGDTWSLGDEPLPEIDSVIDVFPTANFQEREVYDFFGIRFRGHPDLRRILMPESYVGWPQRRDFPIGGDPVLFTHNEHEFPRWYAHD
ncbi:MAG: NADH-quinone oxidoreductase subunit C [Solirubrobacterales bacterium]